MRFVVVGAGSIGTRHGEILREMGHVVVYRDTDPERNTEGRLAPSLDPGYDGYLVCTPTGVRPGMIGSKPVFVEKPMGDIGGRRQKLQIGFCYYFVPSLRRFVNFQRANRISSVTIVGGQNLETWHDGDYRDRYHGTPGRGGVTLDSLPHSLFVARWLLGELEVVGSVLGRLSGLDIDTEDVAAVLLKSSGGVPCYCLVDYVRSPRLFRVEVVTDFSVETWEFDPATEVEVMYTAQMAEFVRLCRGEVQYGRPSWAAGRAVDALLADIRKKR